MISRPQPHNCTLVVIIIVTIITIVAINSPPEWMQDLRSVCVCVCLCVCLSAYISKKPHVQTS